MSSNWNNSLGQDSSSNLTFDLSFWTQVKLDSIYYNCRKELILVDNDTIVLELQSQSNIEYIATKCSQTKLLRHLTNILPFSIGVPANVLALVALVTLRPRTIGLFYIALLTVSDLASIVLRFIDYLMVFMDVFTPTYLCGLRQTVVNFFPCYANWLLVLIVFERFYTLRFPLHKTAHFTFRRAKILVAGVALLLFAYNLPRTFLVENSRGAYCFIKVPFIKNLVAELDKALNFYIPVLLIFFLVALIAYTLFRAQKTRKKMFSSNSIQARSEGASQQRLSCATEGRHSSEAPLNEHTSRMLRQQRRNERTLTMMMLCAAIFFVVMTLPLIVVFYTTPQYNVGLDEMEFKFNANLARGLSLLTHSANFFLYFLTCRRMRTHLWQILRLDKLQSFCGYGEQSDLPNPETEMSKVG